MLKIMFMPKCLATYTEAFTVTTLRCFGKMIPLSGICYDCGQMGLLSRVVGLSSTGAKTDCPVLSLCRQRHKQKVTKGENSKQSYFTYFTYFHCVFRHSAHPDSTRKKRKEDNRNEESKNVSSSSAVFSCLMAIAKEHVLVHQLKVRSL